MANTRAPGRRLSYVYTLLDPTTFDPRYVGQTIKTPEIRLEQHVKHSRCSAYRQHHNHSWIRQLDSVGQLPAVETLESGYWTREETDYREMYWIASLSGLGYNLTNMTSGGCGPRDYIVTTEQRVKLSVASRTAWADEERKIKWSASIRAVWDGNDELKARVGDAARERWTDPEYAARKTLQSDEYREKRRQIATEIASRPGQRERLAEIGRQAALLRAICSTCSETFTIPRFGWHRKKTGHLTYTRVSPEVTEL